jgi:hypothetical protein
MNLQDYGCSNCDLVYYMHLQKKLQGLVLLIPPPSSLMLGLADYIIFICLKTLQLTLPQRLTCSTPAVF